ncbi:hypothetical protein MYCTH_2305743 [Thermothelomyces thermophilus ATCC 42464]|uniref:Only prolin and serin are matching in the corresponding protein n=1 Tax=Thermothelomyces thermophilus (strain ATCC 42464 / BCRC 31852 / DSM 1799) TaxID=573729 RepID=G2QFQ9_THET4|nr:uncharacterized protein MYCTH_2305743 [Thermothelomyces thermophilus ATCC 42464]AEO58427.1 hypothetical protein MYCTH_2305743 [Thermothelomyces thermophilus ATCC 42464]
MSSGLKPLLLPRLVEEKRKLEEQDDGEREPASLYYYTHDSPSSDLTPPSPATSTFSRGHHYRLSGSNSSLELISPPCTDTPASPTQSLHATRPSRSQLPDVEEEPLEREEDEPATPPKHSDRDFGFLNYCLCDSPCSHNGEATQSTPYPYMVADLDYDLGFLSDGDFNASPRQKKRRHGSESGFSSWSARLGSRLPSLPRWRSSSISRRHDLTFAPGSDPSLADSRPSFSLAASSRSSSISRRARATDRAQESVPGTPALSFYESAESVDLASPRENLPATLGREVERDRVNATTPLLPPLVIEKAPSHHTRPPSLQTSPLQSPSMMSAPVPDLSSAAKSFTTPPLSSKTSVSSLHRGTISGAFSDSPSPIPCLFDHRDSWSDRLGHANFIIEPRPYVPDTADLATHQAFRADWDLARKNYAKHLARIGEHYGSTSKTYALTAAKWAEIEQEWQRDEDDLLERLGRQCKDNPSVVSQLRRTAEERVPTSIPLMLSDDGKFPELGDVEIIGPMMRETTMARDGASDEKRSGASGWLKNLAEKVRLRNDRPKSKTQ